MHPHIKHLDEVINKLIDDKKDDIRIQTDQEGDWTVQIPFYRVIGRETFEYYNDFCLKHKLQWLIVIDIPDVFMQLTPNQKEVS